MADVLRVRMYNVRFGDAILITVPDRNPSSGRVKTRRILIDLGNAPRIAGTGEGGSDDVFERVVGSVLDELDGKPLDLYVMTHEHLDHVQGLFYASSKLPTLDLANRLEVRYVWLTASADPDYYTDGRHPEAKKQKFAFDQMYAGIAAHLAARPGMFGHGVMEMFANNDPSKTTPCVDFLRTLNPAKTSYIWRGVSLRGKHGFKEAKFDIWAPEEDTSDYYGRFQPLDTDATPVGAASSAGGRAGRALRKVPKIDPRPPQGVDAGAFLQLVESRRSGIADNLLAIDKAANNTSIVFALEWRGWRLLFAGDAEVRSWKTMAREQVLKPVHFLKVSHHGSHNGTPADEIFEAILPAAAPDALPRRAAISTWTDTYPSIPHTPTNTRLASRADLRSTLDHPDDLFYELEFPG